MAHDSDFFVKNPAIISIGAFSDKWDGESLIQTASWVAD